MHKITDVDLDSRTGECAECGPVPIKVKNGRTRCLTAYRAQRRREEKRSKRRRTRRSQDGYVQVYAGQKYIAMEHRIVMESMLGRSLLQHETVHHINGVRHDNRPENLELWSSSHPKGQRVQDKLNWAREIIALYSK